MQWLVYSPIDVKAARMLDNELQSKLDDYLDQHADATTAWTCVPSDRFPKNVRPPRGAQSVFIIDEPPAALADDPIVVAMLRMLLERSQALHVDWGEADMGRGTAQSGPTASALLAKVPAASGLYQAIETQGDQAMSHLSDSTPNEATRPAATKQSLSERVLDSFTAAMEDMEKGIELKEALVEASAPARAWLEYVIRNNASDDDVIDTALDMQPERAARIHKEVEAILIELWK